MYTIATFQTKVAITPEFRAYLCKFNHVLHPVQDRSNQKCVDALVDSALNGRQELLRLIQLFYRAEGWYQNLVANEEALGLHQETRDVMSEQWGRMAVVCKERADTLHLLWSAMPGETDYLMEYH